VADPAVDPDEQPDPSAPLTDSPRARRHAWSVAAGVTAATALALTLAFGPSRRGSLTILAVMGVAYLILTLGAVSWLRQSAVLRQRLQPTKGDITVGFVIALGLYLAALMFHYLVTSEGVANGWLLQLYHHAGELHSPLAVRQQQVFPMTSVATLGAVLLIGAGEEVVWRGWVMGHLRRVYGERRGWLLTTVIYAVAHLPTLWLLRDPSAGPNPLLVVAGRHGSPALAPCHRGSRAVHLGGARVPAVALLGALEPRTSASRASGIREGTSLGGQRPSATDLVPLEGAHPPPAAAEQRQMRSAAPLCGAAARGSSGRRWPARAWRARAWRGCSREPRCSPRRSPGWLDRAGCAI